MNIYLLENDFTYFKYLSSLKLSIKVQPNLYQKDKSNIRLPLWVPFNWTNSIRFILEW